MTGRIASVLAARVTIGGVLFGVPAELVLLAGDPLPSWAQWSAIVHLEPDWGNTVLLGSVLPCLAWIAWALFAYPLIGELLRQLVGRSVLPVGVLLRGQQQAAAALVTAALLSSNPALAAPRSAAAQPTHIRATAAHAGPDMLHAPVPEAEAATRRRQSAAPTVTTYEVRAGDTLWGIAERKLGDGADYPTIVHKSVDIMQPDGRHLTDPDLIIPGWQLDIPTVAATPDTPPTAPSTPPSRPSPSPQTPSVVHTPGLPAPGSSEGTRTETATQESDPGSAETGGSRTEVPSPVAIGGGAAAILAAGLITAITRRRRRQRAARRYGERIPLSAEGPAHDVETQLRAVSDPESAAPLHRAFAALLATARQDAAPLPSLFAVRIDEHDLTVYLHDPATLPDPFRPLFTDRTAWTAPRDAFSIPVEPNTAAPYPALVTVGTDLDGGILLLDLEQHSRLGLTGPDSAAARGMLNAVTAELASVPWGEDIHLSLVGIPERLATELDPYRIHRVTHTGTLIRDISTHLADRRAALDSAGVRDARVARVQLADVESWAPFVILIGTRPTPEEQTELDTLVRDHAATGLVVVTMYATGTGAAIEIAPGRASATFQSDDPTLPPLPFVPQLLDEHTLEETLQIFTRAAAPDEPFAQPTTNSARVPSQTQRSSADRADPRDTNALLTPHRQPTVTITSQPSRQHLDACEDAPRVPYLRLLGPIEIQHVHRSELIPGRGVELLTYLLHQRQPVAGAQIQKALWPTSYDRTNGNLRSLAKQVRAALGHDPDGHLWLPEGRGNGGFTTHPAIRSDWRDFQDLTSPDLTSIATEQLAAALRLVRGQPLLGTDGHRGRWAWRAPLEETMIASIQDTALTLADRAIADGDRVLVTLAVRATRFADPLSELSWQIELRAALASGTPAQVDRIVADLHATAGYGNPDYEPDPKTTTLIRSARSATSRTRS